MNKRQTILWIAIGIFLCPISTRAQQFLSHDSLHLTIYFKTGSSRIDTNFVDNQRSIATLQKRLANLPDGVEVTNIDIVASTSPEGSISANKILANNRSMNAAKLVAKIIAPSTHQKVAHIISNDVVSVSSINNDWMTLARLIQKSDIADKDSILNCFNEQDETIRLKKLQSMPSYRFALDSLFPELRCVRLNILFRDTADHTVYYPFIAAQNLDIPQVSLSVAPANIMQSAVNQPIIPDTFTTKISQPWHFLIKTNLFYDLATVANLGFECSWGKHYSFDFPITYSPYTVHEKYRMRTLSLQPEFRYWIKQPNYGHFVGVHSFFAYYNISIGNSERYQDKDGKHPLWGFGLSYGYAIPLDKQQRWGMEFTAGIGYARLKYDIFYNIHNGARFDSRTYNYWGLTKVGVNLSYKLK